MRATVYREINRVLKNDERLVHVVQTRGGEIGRDLLLRQDGHEGSLGSDELDSVVLRDAKVMLDWEFAGTRTYTVGSSEQSVEVFFRSFLPRPLFYIFGAVNSAESLAPVASLLGYEVIVCDAREALISRERFPDAHRLIVGWPHEVLEKGGVDARTCICVLTHDPKFDVPALKYALTGPAGYVGALGSRRTHEARLEELRREGISEASLSRIHAPIGLDVGAERPAEVAVAIAAEVISVQSKLRPR